MKTPARLAGPLVKGATHRAWPVRWRGGELGVQVPDLAGGERTVTVACHRGPGSQFRAGCSQAPLRGPQALAQPLNLSGMRAGLRGGCQGSPACGRGSRLRSSASREHTRGY